MEKLEAFAITFIFIYFASELAFYVWMRIFKDMYSERTQELRRSNDIRIRHFDIRTEQQAKLKIVDNKREPRMPTAAQINVKADVLRTGQGVGALIPNKENQ